MCLNCNRMEQTECECPCECRLQMDFCSGDVLADTDVNARCPSMTEHIPLQSVPKSLMTSLEQCLTPNCEQRLTYRYRRLIRLCSVPTLHCVRCDIERDTHVMCSI